MRAILVLAMSLLAFEGAAAEFDIPQALPATTPKPVRPAANDMPSIAEAEHDTVLTGPQINRADPELTSAAAGDVSAEPGAQRPESLADAGVAQSLEHLCTALLTSAQNNKLPVAFFANLIWQESRLQCDAVSAVGALGIAQFMPQTAAEAGLGDPFDPRQAIPASARLLHALRQQFGNLGFVAAAYNAGAHRVSDWLVHRRTLPRETQIYVVRVTGRSVDEWRRMPPDDSALRFVRPLPCRELPAFIDIEQAQSQPMQTRRAQIAREVEERAIAGRRQLVGRGHDGGEGRAAAVRELAGNLRGGRRDGRHPQHLAHERRKIA